VVTLSPEQLARLPATFQELRDLSLELEYTWDFRDDWRVNSEACALFVALSKRAPKLDRARVPVIYDFDYQIPDMRILRLLVETHSISSSLPLFVCFNEQIEFICQNNIPNLRGMYCFYVN